jgi:hypothetical protein
LVRRHDIVEDCIYRWKSKHGSIKMAEATQQWSVEVKHV